MDKKNEMEVIKQGTDNVNAQDALSCCWPPGTMNMEQPSEE